MAVSALDTPSTVSQLARRIGGALRGVGDGWVEGEVRAIKHHQPSGHVYLTLADEGADLRACIWRGRVSACAPLPREGELVQAHYERVDFHARRGTSLIVDALKPTGEGELLRRRAETLRRLEADGLCDPGRRRPLPRFPLGVGVIAGHGSAAKGDVIRHLRERFPPLRIVFCPALVQGVDAVGSVIDALGRLQAIAGIDVIILARGGGSVADLVAFDDERLCRAIFACALPVISSIGHTRDRTNCDRVAAAYAPVPAKAPELAIARSAAELLRDLDGMADTLARMPMWVARIDEQVGGLIERSGVPAQVVRLAGEVDGAGKLLAARCGAAYERHRLLLKTMGSELRSVAARLLGPSALDVTATQITAAAARLRERCGDQAAALERRGREAARELERALAACARETDGRGAALRPAIERVLARARERVEHLCAVIDAKDFSRRGLVLATDAYGNAVTALGDLRVGAAIRLRFADGEAVATIDRITDQRLEGDGR